MELWITLGVVIAVLSFFAAGSAKKYRDMRMPFIWGFNTLLPVALVYCFYGKGDWQHKLLIISFVGIYLLRMNVVLTIWYENTAAAKLKDVIPSSQLTGLSLLLVNIFGWIYCLPFYWAADLQGSFSYLEYSAIGVYIVGTIWHFGSDYQKRKFKLNPANKGKIINVGFWRYSRHPNYFGDFLIFVSFGMISGSIWGIVAPLANIAQYFSDAIPKSEKMAEDRYGHDWMEYKKSVKCFIPWVY
ncbi:DUF1295 domain-containing protein [Spartinivicinus poritis]|uniref:DUF1295 domain-containing protein n=1 Tax=Spartinivicinus poritis TaxID=2994640 RepID=A0ABT5U7N2_9GAMM|nr:DUF1295 domain-containing protein [Spartinivicinus sp. A2-2]MDE1461517.1 DUF1295 domain-containing protein [Spartinivicinus sp. A2-2]